MPLMPPGSAAPMPMDTTPENVATTIPAPPPLPGAFPQAAPGGPPPLGSVPPPPGVTPAIHQPDDDSDEAPTVEVLGEIPPPPGQGVPPAPPAAANPAAVPQAPAAPAVAPAPPPAAQPTATIPAAPVAQVPAAPSTINEEARHNAMMPAGGSGNKVLEDLAGAGFEGLDIGFGSFPVIRLQDQSFSTSDGDVIGSTFLCVVHASRTKWLYKADDSKDTDDFVYSYDQQYTTAGRPIEEVTAEWEAKGFTEPVWKKYIDVTAQMVDANTRSLGNVVILSVPNNSVPRLTGYLTTILLGQRLQPNEVITQVMPGQRVTSAKKPFYPWAFKLYCRVDQLLNQ